MLQSIEEETRRKDGWNNTLAIWLVAGAAVTTIIWIAFLARLLINLLINLF